MPRRRRSDTPGAAFHVLNRAVARRQIFTTDGDYAAFETILLESKRRAPLKVLAWCIMPNHWHLVVAPGSTGELSEFFRLATVTHVQRWHAVHGTAGTGALYQGRFKSFPIATDEHLLTVLRYVERNPLRAGLVQRAEDWPFSSLRRRLGGSKLAGELPDDSPVDLPERWSEIVDGPERGDETEAVRRSIRRSSPFGPPQWMAETASRLGTSRSLRSPGRRPQRPNSTEVDSTPDPVPDTGGAT